MADFKDSELWTISAFERARLAGREGPGVSIERPTLLPTTLLSDLQRLEKESASDDVLEIIAACLRHREAALLYLAHGDYVWPVTIFPAQQLYHSPLDVSDVATLSGLRLMSTEPPGVLPPGHTIHERVGAAHKYRPLSTLLWKMALHGPRERLLGEIGGKAAYRLTGTRTEDLPAALGALLPAARRLRQDPASLRDMASWPGMSVARASRLLNALYLNGSLIVSRGGSTAREPSSGWRGFFSRRR